jgi:hypothetical protein
VTVGVEAKNLNGEIPKIQIYLKEMVIKRAIASYAKMLREDED